ncbi:protein-export chaperone SecB [Coralloluteibacterium thermophilus]|uniref:Protein-export protein SecB n=1 Tax=Coralloluteibacterium thermophilum TaxID=2707049 RepID=A0ABV9NIW8_9GAMM
MADETTNGAAAATDNAQQQGAQFAVQKIYLKDVSFEAPNAPQIFNEQGQPNLQLNLSQAVNSPGQDVYEVSLTLTLTCTVGEKNAYLVEVTQAGIFTLAGFEPRVLDAMLGTQCPGILFPYARQAITDLVQGGGFPPFFLQPINFDALYAESLRRRAEQQQAQGESAQQPPAGNA